MATAHSGENLESLLKRFRQEVENEGILRDFRKHEYFLKPSLKRHQHIKKIKRIHLLEKREKERNKGSERSKKREKKVLHEVPKVFD
jgi:small subunit ribosomal protein S21